MSLRRLLAPSLAAVLLLPLAACGGAGDDGRPSVVASFYPLQFIAERVVGDHAKVSNLTTPGVEPHDLDLRPRQALSLATADVALVESGLQPAVDAALRNDRPKQVIDVAKVVHLRPAGDDPHHDEDGHDHGEGAVDPHFWLDPNMMAEVAAKFTATMVKVDPANSADYEANGKRLQADLADLDAELAAGLKTCARRTIVVSHDAFGYFAARYDLTVVPIAGLAPDAEPSPRRIQQLGEEARAAGVTTVFSERLAPRKIADTLAHDLGLDTAVLDPAEGLTKADSGENYLSLMRANLTALRKANQCS